MGCFSKSKGSSATSTTTTKTPEQKAELARALKLYGPTLGKNENVWQGERVTPFTPLQSHAVSGAANYTDFLSTPQTVGTPLFDQTGKATASLLDGTMGAQKITDQQVQDYFTQKHYTPAMTALREDINPLIDEAYAGPGFFGSARSHERAEAAKDTQARLAEEWAGLNWNVTQQNQVIDEAKANRALSTLTPAMQYGQIPAQEIRNNIQIAAEKIGGLNNLFGFGAKEQTQEQMELEAEITKFAEENQITDPDNLAIMLTLLGLNFQTSSTSQKGPTPAGMGYNFLESTFSS